MLYFGILNDCYVRGSRQSYFDWRDWRFDFRFVSHSCRSRDRLLTGGCLTQSRRSSNANSGQYLPLKRLVLVYLERLEMTRNELCWLSIRVTEFSVSAFLLLPRLQAMAGDLGLKRACFGKSDGTIH